MSQDSIPTTTPATTTPTTTTSIPQDQPPTDASATPSAASDWTVREGTPVITFDGQKIGEVDNATGDFLLVKKGFLFPKEYSIPAEAIENIGPDAVYLKVTKDIALAQGWDAPLSPSTTTATPQLPTTPASAPQPTVVTGEPQVAAPLIGTFSDDRAGTYVDRAAGTESVDSDSAGSSETIAPGDALRDRDAARLTSATTPAGIGADAQEIPANPIATGAVPGDKDLPTSGSARGAVLAEHDEVLAEGVDSPHLLRTPDPLPALDAPEPYDEPAPADGDPHTATTSRSRNATNNLATDASLENAALDPLISEDATEDPDPELPTPSGPADRV